MKRWLAAAAVTVVIAVVLLGAMVSWDSTRPSQTLTLTAPGPLPPSQAPRSAKAAGTTPGTPAGATQPVAALDSTPPHLRAPSASSLPRARGIDHSQKLPDLPVSQIIALNRDRALAGDTEAAYDIGAALWQCSRFAARERAIASQAPGSPFLQSDLRDAESWLNRCEGVGTKELSQMLFWIELAANNGSIPAMNLYRIATLEEMTAADMLANPEALARYKRKSLDYLFASVNAGSIGGLRSLAEIYAFGTMVPKDPVMAYAYELAHFQRGDKSELGKQILNAFSENLSDAERARGQQLAERILANCCG